MNRALFNSGTQHGGGAGGSGNSSERPEPVVRQQEELAGRLDCTLSPPNSAMNFHGHADVVGNNSDMRRQVMEQLWSRRQPMEQQQIGASVDASTLGQMMHSYPTGPMMDTMEVPPPAAGLYSRGSHSAITNTENQHSSTTVPPTAFMSQLNRTAGLDRFGIQLGPGAALRSTISHNMHQNKNHSVVPPESSVSLMQSQLYQLARKKRLEQLQLLQQLQQQQRRRQQLEQDLSPRNQATAVTSVAATSMSIADKGKKPIAMVSGIITPNALASAKAVAAASDRRNEDNFEGTQSTRTQPLVMDDSVSSTSSKNANQDVNDMLLGHLSSCGASRRRPVEVSNMSAGEHLKQELLLHHHHHHHQQQLGAATSAATSAAAASNATNTIGRPSVRPDYFNASRINSQAVATNVRMPAPPHHFHDTLVRPTLAMQRPVAVTGISPSILAAAAIASRNGDRLQVTMDTRKRPLALDELVSTSSSSLQSSKKPKMMVTDTLLGTALAVPSSSYPVNDALQRSASAARLQQLLSKGKQLQQQALLHRRLEATSVGSSNRSLLARHQASASTGEPADPDTISMAPRSGSASARSSALLLFPEAISLMNRSVPLQQHDALANTVTRTPSCSAAGTTALESSLSSSSPSGLMESSTTMWGQAKLEKPKRPLSAYNLFFKDERAKMMEELAVKEEAVSDEEDRADEVSDDPLQQSHKKKRRKRKKRPKIGFAVLAQTIGSRWKSVDEERLAAYKVKAAEEKNRYERECAAYKAYQAREQARKSAEKGE